jgi:hypothetical protein
VSGYTCDVDIYLGKNRANVTPDMMVTRVTVRHVTRRVDGRGPKLYVDRFLYCLDYQMILQENQLLEDSHVKWGSILSRTRDGLKAIIWRDELDLHIATDMHTAPADGHFCEESGCAVKPAIM